MCSFIEHMMLRLCARNYQQWRGNNWIFVIKYATLPESRENSFWLNRGMKKQRKQQQRFSSFLVLDFEATCERGTAIEPQEMVNNQLYFKETFVQFQKWLEETECWNSHNKSMFVTCGDWDLQIMLPKQCRLSSVDIPSEMKHWINIKKAFSAATGYFPRGIIDMLTKLQLPHQGRLHSGIDDCHNIAAVLKELINRGFVFEETSHLNLDKI
ncbi:ERI1 exoribonuclease 3 isoform X2 [Cryptotermes secundus]|uniref:ERI1 exoribonuclease 3 isoform X2 n=1 Tax=Cryptotermes secundus TaxID=105785 RepID=UPI000CD7BBFD|nr:ERI1 exoribonuclease 3 isoform X2 [Cryptotermes secundus]